MQKPANNPARVKSGKLVLICDLCAQTVNSEQGFLTVRERASNSANTSAGIASKHQLRIYHNYCAAKHGVVCEALPGVNGGRPCKINTSQIATADLLLSALATLAGELKTVDWLQFVQKVTADTDWYFDELGLDGGKRKSKALMEENQEMYAKAGFNQHLNLKGNNDD